MMSENKHIPVLLNEILAFAAENGRENKHILDCTLGGGGHAEALLTQNPSAFLFGLDQDEAALKLTGKRLEKFSKRMYLTKSNFSEASTVLASWASEQDDMLFDFILADLGFSSNQIEDASRGLSFAKDGPLDMRLDTSSSLTAAEVVNEYPEGKLRAVLQKGGVRADVGAITNAILKHRPIQSTRALSQIIDEATKIARFKRDSDSAKNPATVVFQAIRIAVNNELESLESLLAQIPNLLAPRGRVAIISFHSLEDEIVTQTMRSWSRGEEEPLGLPTRERTKGLGELLTKKAVVPSEEEMQSNPRARSAKLRVFEMN